MGSALWHHCEVHGGACAHPPAEPEPGNPCPFCGERECFDGVAPRTVQCFRCRKRWSPCDGCGEPVAPSVEPVNCADCAEVAS